MLHQLICFVLFCFFKLASDPAKDHTHACCISSVGDLAACIITDPHHHTFRIIHPDRSFAPAHITMPSYLKNIIWDCLEKWRRATEGEGEGREQKPGQVEMISGTLAVFVRWWFRKGKEFKWAQLKHASEISVYDSSLWWCVKTWAGGRNDSCKTSVIRQNLTLNTTERKTVKWSRKSSMSSTKKK